MKRIIFAHHHFDLSFWRTPIFGKKLVYNDDDNAPPKWVDSLPSTDTTNNDTKDGKILKSNNDNDDDYSYDLIDDSSLESIVIDDDDNKINSDNDDVSIIVEKEQPKKKTSKKNPFIIDEAEDPDDDEITFVDDYSEGTQRESQKNFIATPSSELDLDKSSDYSNYLKSTKDLVGLPEPNKYKLKYDYDKNLNVYSQAVIQLSDDEDDYEMDSFCNDEIVYITDSEVEKTPINQKKKRNVSKKSMQQHTSSTPMVPSKKRRRVIIESP